MTEEIISRFIAITQQPATSEQVLAMKELVSETSFPFWQIPEVDAWVKENKTLIVETLG